MIRLEHVSYTYPEAASPALSNVTMEVEEGEFLLVSGPSGAGKSTLLRCLNGLVPHFYGGTFGGQVEVFGHDPVAKGAGEMSRLVGLVFQDPEAQCVAGIVEDELAFAMENHGLPRTTMRKRVEEVLSQLGIAHLRERRLETLSGGERQRVAIGAVLTLQPRLLVLDEPTSQLDPQGAAEVMDALLLLNRNLGLTVILSEHRLERVVRHVDRILYLPGAGRPALLGEPRKVLLQVDLVPPLITLGKALGWRPLPLTVREARRFLAAADAGRPPAGRAERSPDSSKRNLLAAAPSGAQPGPEAIRVEGVSFSYNGRPSDRAQRELGQTAPDKPALRDVHLSVRHGEIIVLMGPNGAGKTTLLKQMVGLLRPQRGRVEVCGLDTQRTPLERIVEHVGYVPQNPDALLFADTVQEELDYTLRQHGRRHQHGRRRQRDRRRQHDRRTKSYGELPVQLGLEEHYRRYPRDLSVGERQRVALAAVLVAQPEVILLDEPTRGLDYLQKEILVSFLKQQRAQGRAIVLATHDVELAAHCADRVVILDEGEIIVEGPVRQVMTDSPAFSSQINRLYRDPRYLTVRDILGGNHARVEEEDV